MKNALRLLAIAALAAMFALQAFAQDTTATPAATPSGPCAEADAKAARRALALVEQGKTSDVWIPVNSQQEAVPGLNYYLGFFTLESSPAEAAKYLVKVAQSNSSFSKEPSTYDFLGLAYYNSEFK